MKEQLAVLNRWLEEAQEQGGTAAQDHLKAVARILGSHVAQVSSSDAMPEMLTSTIDEMGKGVSAGMLMHHGQAGRLAVQMFSMSRGGR
ncbi:hypothetical protein D3P09_02455 [Paenibacillus pinisoli]|uniref:Uncharacterized protein n=1 Tax=Paenibacillus pinisoli TaxID=1276110 RepID=A0A3A6PGE9_9BACL|nr:hypothetical protein [Paenibacillus pinisoli]RJX40902.1 hypothetical protein D3P09_02455 [Paenibacillus pinisoli]